MMGKKDTNTGGGKLLIVVVGIIIVIIFLVFAIKHFNDKTGKNETKFMQIEIKEKINYN